MAIKELVDQVRSNVNSEDLEKVGSLLETIKSEAAALQDAKTAVDTESKNRRLKIRDLEQSKETVELERDEWKTKYEGYDDTDIKSERDNYKTKYTDLLKSQKDSFIKFFDKIKEHPNFEKVQSEYHIPEKKDDKFDWESLQDDQLEKNLERSNYHQQIDYFKVEGTKPNPPTGKTSTVDGKVVPSREEYFKMVNEKGLTHPDVIEAQKLRRLTQRSD